MTTTCLDCSLSTGVRWLGGVVGLPSLDETPRQRGKHPLSRELTTGETANTDETFGYIYSGFRAIGLFTHPLETYREFLESHSSHRLFLWEPEDDQRRLPRELKDAAVLASLSECEYQPPRAHEGYVQAGLSFECGRCEDTFEGDETEWTRPFQDQRLTKEQNALFRKAVCRPADCCIRQAEPFGIFYMSLDEWLMDHKNHPVTMRLLRDRI